MEENKTLKIISLCGFAIFAAVSCWATAESLHLLLPSWPSFMCWAVTIGFFVIASIGTKLIVDSFNQNIYLEKRGLRLIGGILLTLVFWLICSMPTNTHTFFYRTAAPDIVTQDLALTKSYLQQLRDNVKNETEIKEKLDSLERGVNSGVTALFNEIENMAQPGFGPRAKAILIEIAKDLLVSRIPELSYQGTTASQQKALKDQYNAMIGELLNNRKSELRTNYTDPQEKLFMPEAAKAIEIIESIEDSVMQMDANGVVDNNLIAQADIALQKGYTTIKNYADYVTFKSDSDKELYTADNLVTKTTKLLSVIDVWKDFLAGKHAGRGFVFWIVISILVDIAAFIFFDIAFKKRED
ncbi:MAG: hypothetical protein IJA98_01845 [Bacteroidaceae bacterium]|nr:hypothetical protein [Bacteroidaceae bacterium]